MICLHALDKPSPIHAAPANVLVLLTDVKDEGDLEMVACPSHHTRRRRRMEFGGYTV